MEIAALDVHDATQTEELFTLREAVHAADCPDNPRPLWDQHLAELRMAHPEVRVERLVARIDGHLVGDATLELPEVDQRHLAVVNLRVSPAYRRRGVGRALLQRLRERGRAERRRTLLAPANGPVPGGPARDDAGAWFLEAMGFSRVLGSVARRIDLPATDEAAEQRLLEECLPHAEDYESVSWTGLTPDALASGVVYLTNRLITDAPMGDLDLEESTVDTGRLHADERHALGRHIHLFRTAARHRPTGAVAAVTGINVRSAGDHGSVWVTIADPEHRGHRLGTIIKIENQRLVRRALPQLRYVSTGNADTNVHIATINERLGFVAFQVATNYQLSLS